METLFAELKRYVGWDAVDERVLRGLHRVMSPEFTRIADVFYRRILEHDQARTALVEGESQVGRLKVTLVAWMNKLFQGPWDEEYFDLRCRIGRVHVRIALPQHYMFGAMNVIRQELNQLVDREFAGKNAEELRLARQALGKILDLELAIMLHTYREDLIAQSARHERLSTFGQLVASIGHELRNPLGVIESSLYILKSRVTEDERGRKHVERIAEQLGLANGIITALLDMIRDRPLTLEEVRLALLADSAVQSLALPEGVELVRDGIDELPPIQADARQLRQVLFNLLENAVHAIAADASGDGAPRLITLAGRAEQNAVELSVTDTGPGIDASVRSRLFEPLVSTKARGIGLGLALVKRIVERHGGTVTCEGGPGGHGTRFVVRLPIAQTPPG